MEKLFEHIPNDIMIALTLALLLAAAGSAAVNFLRRPDSLKRAVVQEWLLWAVARAEMALGSGTGEKKLKMVYCWFEVRFPILCRLVSFEEFRGMVDGALDELEYLLSSHKIDSGADTPLSQPAADSSPARGALKQEDDYE